MEEQGGDGVGDEQILLFLNRKSIVPKLKTHKGAAQAHDL